eukprot:GHVL01014001.1.p1 GENE.GHVL01014001.1~~GHVL01014001.1.p1  ORF type:complete len:194 (-),score=31.17 GHVL01014001.1:200-781(-)
MLKIQGIRFFENHAISMQHRCFGIKRVTQKRKIGMKILRPIQSPYIPKSDDYSPLPIALLGSGPIRRLIRGNAAESERLAAEVDWDKYKCNVKGVRWHPMGGWRVQFRASNHERNFIVKCSTYFRVSEYGLHEAKRLAISYRKRLEAEWEELNQCWDKLDLENRGNGRKKDHWRTNLNEKMKKVPFKGNGYFV